MVVKSRIIAVVVAFSSVLVGMGTGVQAAPAPAPGVECTVADLGREVPWKTATGSVTLFCTPADEGGDHVPSLSAGMKPQLPMVQGPGYLWTAFAAPRATSFTGASLTGLRPNALPTSLNAQYQNPDVSPCKVNARSIDQLVSLSYGRNGLLGRRSVGMSDSLGKITVGVFPVVPSNLQVSANGLSASGTDQVTQQDVTVRLGDLVAQALSNIQPYLSAYFQEQSYGRMTLEFVTYDKLLQGGVSQSGYVSGTEPNYSAQATAGSRAIGRVSDSWWEGPGKDVDLLWAIEWKKPGAYLWSDPRTTSSTGVVRTNLTIETPAGPFRGLILSPSSLPLSDRPLIAHEVGHALRLPDMYQQRDNTVASRMVARIGRMGSGYTVSGMFGWDRYINRWLSDAQVECITGDRLRNARGEYVDVSLTPLQNPATGKPNKRLAVIPLMDEGTAIMVESWRPLGSDAALQANTRDGGTGADGALVYLMDARNSAASGLYVDGGWPYSGAPVVLYREEKNTVLPATSGTPLVCLGIPESTTTDAAGNTVPLLGVNTPACNLAVQGMVRTDAFLTTTAAQAEGQTWGRLARYVVSVMSPILGNDQCGLSAVDGQALMKRELTIELISRSETEGDRVRVSLGKRIC